MHFLFARKVFKNTFQIILVNYKSKQMSSDGSYYSRVQLNECKICSEVSKDSKLFLKKLDALQQGVGLGIQFDLLK